jgi:hypothetical protein
MGLNCNVGSIDARGCNRDVGCNRNVGGISQQRSNRHVGSVELIRTNRHVGSIGTVRVLIEDSHLHCSTLCS